MVPKLRVSPVISIAGGGMSGGVESLMAFESGSGRRCVLEREAQAEQCVLTGPRGWKSTERGYGRVIGEPCEENGIAAFNDGREIEAGWGNELSVAERSAAFGVSGEGGSGDLGKGSAFGGDYRGGRSASC